MIPVGSGGAVHDHQAHTRMDMFTSHCIAQAAICYFLKMSQISHSSHSEESEVGTELL